MRFSQIILFTYFRSNSSYTRLSDATKHTNTKSRRSKRIQNKERAKRAKLNVDGPLGYFDALPPEVAEQVFLKMDCKFKKLYVSF